MEILLYLILLIRKEASETAMLFVVTSHLCIIRGDYKLNVKTC